MLIEILFYFLATVLVLSALGVVTSRNPIYCVLLLILCFVNGAGLFLLAGAEFLGLLMIMVYVGAIAVLFLFVLMTTDIDFAMLKEGFIKSVPLAVVVAVILASQLILAIKSGVFSGQRLAVFVTMPQEEGTQNITALGEVMFTDFLLPFQGSALILLIAMIGAIVLTHRQRGGVKRQNVTEQIARRREDCVENVKVKPGQGV